MKDADPCIYSGSCAQYNEVKWNCNYASGPGTCKLWSKKAIEVKK